MKSRLRYSLFSSLLLLVSFRQAAAQEPVDLLVYNARIYTVDETFSTATAMAVKNGRIAAIGETGALKRQFKPEATVDAGGKFIYPGFIDAHAHFYEYALELQQANLFGTSSWEAVLQRLQAFAGQNREGWLRGRGWDQNDWKVKEFPAKDALDRMFPDRPVLLTRVDGHAAIANQRALDLAGISAGTKVEGGEVLLKNGQVTGVMVDNAINLVAARIPVPTDAEVHKSLMQAQRNCFAMGLTTVDDCGLDYRQVLFMDSLQKAGLLKMRIYAMLSDAPRNYQFLFSRGKIKTDRMHVRGFKVYADGALGSRGAALLQPYADRPDWSGFLLSPQSHFDSVASIIYRQDMQMCTHAIGDSGNRTILNIYAKYLEGKNDRRWRIEHAQVVHPGDFSRFGAYSIVPSVQPTHATSDMYWAGQRLGSAREKGAYAFRQLMQQNGWIPLGTDFPVEDISPFKTFLAAVFRVDDKGWPKGGYQPENALSRQDALRGMTTWAARSNFEEGEKGMLKKGMLADFIILDKDLMQVKADEVNAIRVLATYVGGEPVYRVGQ